MNNRNTVRQFVLDHSALRELSDSCDIFDTGAVSSMFVMQLVMFVEQAFDINIDGPDLNIDYFRTIDSVCQLVDRKLAEKY